MKSDYIEASYIIYLPGYMQHEEQGRRWVIVGERLRVTGDKWLLVDICMLKNTSNILEIWQCMK